MEALRSVSRRFWGPAPPRPSPPPARPFWLRGVGEGRGEGEGRPRGVLAASLGELREQAASLLGLPPGPALALAQDGTLVEDEEFFGSLAPHSELLALGPGQRWEPPRDSARWDLGGGPGVSPEAAPDPSRGSELARLSLLRGRGRARGGLRLRAQVRGLRWDLGPDNLLRELLRLVAALCRSLGQALLGLSGALRPLLEGPPGREGPR